MPPYAKIYAVIGEVYMKKVKNFFAVLPAAILAATMFFACTKQQENGTAQSEETGTAETPKSPTIWVRQCIFHAKGKQKMFKGRPVKIDYDNSIYEYEYEMAEPITFETNGTDRICYGTSSEPNFNALPTSLRKLTQSKLRFRSILTGIRVNSHWLLDEFSVRFKKFPLCFHSKLTVFSLKTYYVFRRSSYGNAD